MSSRLNSNRRANKREGWLGLALRFEGFDETQTIHPYIEFLDSAALEHIPPGVIG